MTGTGYANVVPFQRPSAAIKLPNLPAPEAPQIVAGQVAEPDPAPVAEPSEVIAEPAIPFEPEQVRQFGDEIAEPEASASEENQLQIDEPVRPIEPIEIAEPLKEPVRPIEPAQIAEPMKPIAEPVNSKVRPIEISEIAEPENNFDGEDVELDDNGAFDEQVSLWNLTAYEDRHGKLRAKRVLRFVSNPPKRDVGIVTESLKAELEQRRGRGRWNASRADAEQLKRAAQLVADAYWAAKTERRKSEAVSKPGNAKDRARKR